MGAWGMEPFENDDASDWAYELEAGDLRTHLLAAVSKVANWPADEYMEVTEGNNALAAAQVIAYLRGTEPLTHSAELAAVLEQQKFSPDAELFQTALRALDRVQAAESELKDLWEESEDYADWQAVVERVRMALRVP